MIPIHLTAEGYNDTEVVTTDALEGLELGSWIDVEDDWIVRLSVKANIEEAIDKEVKVPFSLKVLAEDRVDPVAIGEIIILPASYDRSVVS
jgi:hypothetical protein